MTRTIHLACGRLAAAGLIEGLSIPPTHMSVLGDDL